ncbi:hypothetical protein LbFV_ORF73 [Leptopilina boulardi filamentous virus]|uniref:Uncharacterized protein n=1 Tax=Leptopilina boulardi filamentous virus TaxID=552509 RepID=A0A1S5YD36_9VIRU|nr:hypothetical protein LbFV_ORF73 [Leptopilina boulardi filamentous virus]AQQ79993.1 hypothetical protein LbFV_ORF73 [Leptopilina boulardi filamentous virus]
MSAFFFQPLQQLIDINKKIVDNNYIIYGNIGNMRYIYVNLGKMFILNVNKFLYILLNDNVALKLFIRNKQLDFKKVNILYNRKDIEKWIKFNKDIKVIQKTSKKSFFINTLIELQNKNIIEI